MRKYMGLLVGVLLLLALAGCGGKAAETVEETSGDPTGTVKVVAPQKEQTSEASDGAEQQPAAGGEQTAQPPAQQEKPPAQTENTQEPQAPQTPATSGTEKPEDIWYEGLEYLPSGSEMVRRASTYKPEKAAQAGNDYLVSKGAVLNSAIDPESCGYQEAFIWCSEAFLSGGTAYLTTKMIAAADRALADAYDLDAFEFYCIGEKLEFTGDCNYRLRVYYREKA